MNVDYKLISITNLINNIKQFKGFSDLFRFKEQINLDSSLFYLHSVVTVFILFIGTVFLTMNQYFGHPIKCLTSNDKSLSDNLAMIQHYCWMEGIFSLPNLFHSPSQPNLYPGAGQFNNHFEKKVYHRYYQWVYFILIIQSVLFYFPRRVWKKSKSTKIRSLLNELNGHILTYNDDDKYYFLQEIADLISTGKNYLIPFFLCEMFYLVHLMVEIWFTNIFLGGSFWRLGYEWLFFSDIHNYDPYKDPLIQTFPRLAKCTFHSYGITGTVETRDLLCFLPMNIVNEKLYIVLWFWFWALFLITLITVASRFIYIIPCFRRLYLQSLAPNIPRRDLVKLTKTLGGFFVVQQIARNMKPFYFVALVEELSLFLYDDKGRQAFSNRYKEMLMSTVPSTSHKPTAPLLAKAKDKSKSKNKSSNSKPPTIGFNITANDEPKTSTANTDEPFDWQADNNGNNTNNSNTTKQEDWDDNWNEKTDDGWN